MSTRLQRLPVTALACVLCAALFASLARSDLGAGWLLKIAVLVLALPWVAALAAFSPADLGRGWLFALRLAQPRAKTGAVLEKVGALSFSAGIVGAFSVYFASTMSTDPLTSLLRMAVPLVLGLASRGLAFGAMDRFGTTPAAREAWPLRHHSS